MSIDWRKMTPAEVLDSYPALTFGQVAYVLNRLKRNGEPNRSAIHALVRDGRLVVVDDTQPPARQTISANDVRSYLAGKPNLRRVS